MRFDLSTPSSVEANPALGSSVGCLVESIANSISLTVMISGCMKKGTISCILTQNIAQPQPSDAAGHYNTGGWEGALLGDIEGDEGTICFLLMSHELWDLAVPERAAAHGFAAVGHLAELCLQHADRVCHLGRVHLVGCLLAQEADEDLLEALAEVFGDQGVDDGVHAGVGIGDEMREDAEHVRSVIEGEVSKPDAEDDQVMGQPTEAEQDSYNDDHPGDLPLGLLRL